MEVSVLAAACSDHSPLLLLLKKGKGDQKRRSFHFEASWARNTECAAIIKKLWREK
jgi:hypothetical protein